MADMPRQRPASSAPGGDGDAANDDLDATTVLGAAAGLLREGWSRLDSLTESLAQAGTSSSSSSAAADRRPTSIADLEPHEIIIRLQKQLRRADANAKKTQERMALLKLCLVTACEGANGDVVEFVADVLARPDTDVEADFALFKEKLQRRREPTGDEIVETGTRTAALERELRIERERRELCEAAKVSTELRLDALEDAWAMDRNRAAAEKREMEDAHRARLSADAAAHHARLNAVMQAQDARIKAETSMWQTRCKALETQLAEETRNLQARAVAEEAEKNRAVFEFMSQRDAELERLRARVKELETVEDPERRMLELAKMQASREQIIQALQNSVKEAEVTIVSLQAQLSEASSILGVAQGLVNVPGNLPYLREVVVRYTQFGPDAESQRRSLIPVIATLLNFTDEERKRAEKANAPSSILDFVSSSIASPAKPSKPPRQQQQQQHTPKATNGGSHA